MKAYEYAARLALVGYRIRDGSDTKRDTQTLRDMSVQATKSHGYIARNMAKAGDFGSEKLPDMRTEKEKKA